MTVRPWSRPPVRKWGWERRPCRRSTPPTAWGLPLERVRFEYGDSSLPWAGVAGGSSQTISVALAVQEAAAKLVKELLIAGAESAADSPLARGGRGRRAAGQRGLFLKDMPAIGETYADILRRAGQTFVETEVIDWVAARDHEVFDALVRRTILRGRGA